MGSSPSWPETLTNDFFFNLLDMGIEWKPTSSDADLFEGRDLRHRRHQVDRHQVDRTLGFLESPASRPRRGLWLRRWPERSSLHDFVAAWDKVMNLDRFDLA